MQNFDLHIHTVFSDGKSTPEEIIIKAIEKGIEKIGFSDHSHTFFDESYCMKKEREEEYKNSVRSLSEKYKERIKVLCGIEQDYYSEKAPSGYDYVIGSCHYIFQKGDYFPIDSGKDDLIYNCNKYFGGDFYLLCEEYYRIMADMKKKTNADIIGHFDYISLYNEDDSLFSREDVRYINAYKNAADRLIKEKAVFEINTGGISRGYRKTSYPEENIRNYILSEGGKLIYSSDSHKADTICFGF